MVLRTVTVGSIAMGMIVCVDLVIFLKAISVLFCFLFFAWNQYSANET